MNVCRQYRQLLLLGLLAINLEYLPSPHPLHNTAVDGGQGTYEPQNVVKIFAVVF
jgi:hypothetical protein